MPQIEISDPSQLVQKPLVSVLMITYNHAPYLAQAIEGVVNQRCDFPFELIIGEDCSTDRTLDVARDFQARYPQLVRIICAPNNVGMMANARRIFSAARGEYLSYCEGDDYWCSPDKLSRQVELISSNPAVSIVHSDWVRSKYKSGDWVVNWKRSVHRHVPIRYLKGSLFQTFHYPKILRTCTMMMRRSTAEWIEQSPLGKKTYKFGDSVYALMATSTGEVAYLPEITAVYRHSPNSALRSGVRKRLEFLRSSLEFDTDARCLFVHRSDYPSAYRWELAIGILLWALVAGDRKWLMFAANDIRKHFSVVDFFRATHATLRMRRPALLPNRRPSAAVGVTPAALSDLKP